MRKISDELREWAKLLKRSVYTKLTAEEISAFADRIDAEMVELPRDADGKPIHVGETMYGLRGRGRMVVVSLRLYSEEDPTWMVSMGADACVYPSRITHERPDSFERIADELDEWKRKAAEKIPGFGLEEDALHALADRIRKLAKERGNE